MRNWRLILLPLALQCWAMISHSQTPEELKVSENSLHELKLLVSELGEFIKGFQRYTGLRTNYQIDFDGLPSAYFLRHSGEGKCFSIEEILNSLDSIKDARRIIDLQSNHLEEIKLMLQDIRKRETRDNLARIPSSHFILLNGDIIALEQAFFKKINSKWHLINGCDTVTKFDPWNPNYGPGMKPEKSSIEFELIFLYYEKTPSYNFIKNKRKILFDSIRMSRFVKSDDIYDIVYGQEFQDFYGVPPEPTIQKWLSEEFSRLRKEAETAWSMSLETIQVTFESQNEKWSWIASNDLKTIYVSPFLIRAIYIVFMDQLFDGDPRRLYKKIEKLKTPDPLEVNADIEFCLSIKKSFLLEFRYLFLQGLAQAAFRNESDFESRSQCEMMNIMARLYPEYSFNTLEHIVEQSINRVSSEYWDTENQMDFLKRIKHIKMDGQSRTKAACK